MATLTQTIKSDPSLATLARATSIRVILSLIRC